MPRARPRPFSNTGVAQRLAQPPVQEAADEAGPLDAAIKALKTRIELLGRKSDSGVSGFAKEFYLLDQEDRARFQPDVTRAGRQCSALNRYNDIIPYDQTRVKLGGESASVSESYINASHITGLLSGSPPFIAAQGPLPTSRHAFWQMIIAVSFHPRPVIL